jgi:hypothetical protein
MDPLARLDAASQELLQRFFRKLVLFLVFATTVSFVQIHSLALAGGILQLQCVLGAGMSISIAVYLRQRLDAATLTYWDEALAFSGIGMLSHIAMTLS